MSKECGVFDSGFGVKRGKRLEFQDLEVKMCLTRRCDWRWKLEQGAVRDDGADKEWR